MEEKFIRYLKIVYKGIPDSVYMGLLYFFFISSVLLLFFCGFKRGLKYVKGVALLCYTFLLYCSTFFFRSFKDSSGHNNTPFWSYTAIQNGRDALVPIIIMNVLVFVPVGILCSSYLGRTKWYKVLLIGCGLSLSIETLQFLFNRGFSEFDDIFHNTLGCLIGIMIVAIFKETWKFCSYLFRPQRRPKG